MKRTIRQGLDEVYSPAVMAGWRALWLDVMHRSVGDIRKAKAAYFAAVDNGAGPIEAADLAKRAVTQ